MYQKCKYGCIYPKKKNKKTYGCIYQKKTLIYLYLLTTKVWMYLQKKHEYSTKNVSMDASTKKNMNISTKKTQV
jgi:hypothetical protein